MLYIPLKCKECEEEVDVFCDGDNAMFCPLCRSVDCFEEIIDECKFCKGSGLAQYSNGPCVYC